MKNKVFIYFIIGILIYLVDIGLNSDEEKNIYISDQEVISLISAWKSQVGREPTDNEISRIINNLVQEEILYREALSLGLEREDKIIKRRLAQKISFLKQESLLKEPTKLEISEFYKNAKIECKIFNFTNNILNYFSKVNLAITRSGSSMLAELINARIPFISVPLPSSADDHQLKNAIYYEKNKYSYLVEEKDLKSKLFKLIKKIYEDTSLLDQIVNKQKQFSDKTVYENIDKQIKKIPEAQQVVWVHDEIQVECLEKDAETVGRLAVECIKRTGDYFQLRLPLTGEFNIGNNWSETH